MQTTETRPKLCCGTRNINLNYLNYYLDVVGLPCQRVAIPNSSDKRIQKYLQSTSKSVKKTIILFLLVSWKMFCSKFCLLLLTLCVQKSNDCWWLRYFSKILSKFVTSVDCCQGRYIFQIIMWSMLKFQRSVGHFNNYTSRKRQKCCATLHTNTLKTLYKTNKSLSILKNY
jgi:hypothetical protein